MCEVTVSSRQGEHGMLAITQSLIHELGLVARALGLLGDSVESERARGALLLSVETVELVRQRVIDLESAIRDATTELEQCHREVVQLRALAATDAVPFGPSFHGGSSTTA